MWTRVKMFFRVHFKSGAAITAALRTQADVEEVRGLVLALSAKLTYMQTRRKITESAVCALDDAVTQIVKDYYPEVVELTAARAAAARVQDRIRTEQAAKIEPILPSPPANRWVTAADRSAFYEKDVLTPLDELFAGKTNVPPDSKKSSENDAPSPIDDPSAPDCEVEE